jgi:MtN3 and saliva related transmembrane protein
VDITTLIGLCAATCTTFAFLPQVLKNWKTRSVKDLSARAFSFFAIGIILWLTYGILIGDLPLIAANVVTLALVLINLVQIAWYRRRRAFPKT